MILSYCSWLSVCFPVFTEVWIPVILSQPESLISKLSVAQPIICKDTFLRKEAGQNLSGTANPPKMSVGQQNFPGDQISNWTFLEAKNLHKLLQLQNTPSNG